MTEPTASAILIAYLRLLLAAAAAAPLVVGLCGAQGSGKSTLAAAVAATLAADGIAVAVLSLDDLYLSRADRAALGRRIHPLLATRGVPGTHDVPLGLAIVAALRAGRATPLPRFDKARDDRLPVARWATAPADTRLLLIEGWCVGATPQDDAALALPVNALERDEDATGTWRRFANDALAGPYRALFAALDSLVLLAAPGFDVVLEWRTEQERALVARVGTEAPGAMDAPALRRFVAQYERLTRHILAEMPGRADLVIALDRDRRVRPQ